MVESGFPMLLGGDVLKNWGKDGTQLDLLFVFRRTPPLVLPLLPTVGMSGQTFFQQGAFFLHSAR